MEVLKTSEKRDMKWALELALQTLDDIVKYHCPVGSMDTYRQAADMIRHGGPVVEKIDISHEFRCKKCGVFPVSALQALESINCSQCYSDKIENVETKKQWTEREKIKIITEKSEPTFEEIK